MGYVWKRRSTSPAPRFSLPTILFLCLVVSPGDARLRRTRSVSAGGATEEAAETYDRYYNYTELTGRLQSLAQKHPHIAKLSTIGRSVEGRELWAVRITQHPEVDSPGKPKFKYVGNMHGDETVSRQVLVYLVDYLVTRYEEDPRIGELVNSTDIYILPSMNPDGFERSKEGDCEGDHGGRNNARNMDLNRSFPDQYDSGIVDQEAVPEVAAMMRWIQEKK